MDGNESLKYIEKIVLEIVDRHHFWFVHRREKFNITKFKAREAAYAFLRQYDGEPFVKAQKITVWYNQQNLHLCVRDLIYGTINGNSNTMVEFIYRKGIFSDIKWPTVAVNRTSRVRWATDNHELSRWNTSVNLMNGPIDSDYSSINVDEAANANGRIVPCMLCDNLDDDQSLSMNSTADYVINSLCRDCRIRRSVSGLQRLITVDDESQTLGHTTDDDSHFRSSIHIRVNEIQNSQNH